MTPHLFAIAPCHGLLPVGLISLIEIVVAIHVFPFHATGYGQVTARVWACRKFQTRIGHLSFSPTWNLLWVLRASSNCLAPPGFGA